MKMLDNMKVLLDNMMAPVTFAWGFLEADLQTAGNALLQWRQSHVKAVEMTAVAGLLQEVLHHLEPLSTPHRAELLLQTKSQWTAYFDNGAKGGDPTSAIGHLAQTMRCRGLAVTCVPHTLTQKDKNAKGTYGAVQFELFAPDRREFLNYERSVSVVHDGNRWAFSAAGNVQPYEKSAQYSAPKVRDRFTNAMLEEYCLALKIRLFDPDFYGPKGLLLRVKDPLPVGFPIWSLKEAQEYFGIQH